MFAGAPAALLFGWLSDKVNRKRLLFAAVVLGEPVQHLFRILQAVSMHSLAALRGLTKLCMLRAWLVVLTPSVCSHAGEAPCMLTIFVHNYWQLFTLRLLTGIALGGANVLSAFHAMP